PPAHTIPYTTLFRSRADENNAERDRGHELALALEAEPRRREHRDLEGPVTERRVVGPQPLTVRVPAQVREEDREADDRLDEMTEDRKSTRLNSSHVS